MARIGVVFGQRFQLWWDFPVIESLTFCDIYRVPDADYRRRRDEMIGLLDLIAPARRSGAAAQSGSEDALRACRCAPSCG